MGLTKTNKKFPLQVWAGSVVLYAFWLMVLSLLSTNLSMVSSDFFFGALLFLFASAYLSIPTFLLYTLVFFSVTLKLRSVVLIKLIQSGVAFLGMVLTFFLLPENSLLNPGDDLMIYMVGYLLSIIGASLYFKLRIHSQLSTTQTVL
jgi:hypothetical protein